MNKHILLTLLLFSGLFASAQQSKNVSFLGNLTYADELNDIWGYVDNQNNEYALVGLTTGVSIVDVNTPTNPVALHFMPDTFSNWRDLKTFGSFAYVSNETAGGIRIIDMSGLPANVAYKDTVMAGVTTSHNVYIDEGYLYVVGTNNYNGGMAIFDLNLDPWHPSFVGSYDVRYVHDVYVRNDTAYLAEIVNGFLSIVDVSDKANLQTIGERTYNDAFTHNTWLSDNSNICYTTDEYDEAYINAWDVSDPSDIKFLDQIRSSVSNEAAAPHNTHVLNDFLYTSYYRDGLHITDASRPGNLVEVGYYDTADTLAGGGFNGAWGTYPFLPSGSILVSDIEKGLFILQANVQQACYLEGNITRQDNSAPLSNVEVRFLSDPTFDFSRTNGDYAVGIADAGTYELVFSKYGFETDTITVVLSNGQLVIQDVALVPLPRTDLTIIVEDANTNQPLANAIIELTAPMEAAVFEFTTNSAGTYQNNDFVINPYELIVGKWGYISQSAAVSIDSVNDTLTFLLTPGYYDDFALDFGWTEFGNAVRGRWERGEPIGTYETFLGLGIQNPEFDLPNDIGDECYVTGNDGGDAFGDDVDRGFTQLISPPMDLTIYENPKIHYSWWLLNYTLRNGGGIGNDFLALSLTDGVDTFEVKRYGGDFDTTWNATTELYVRQYFDSLTNPFQLIFYTQDLEASNADAVEAAIDGFSVVEGPPTNIEADEIALFHVRAYPNPVGDVLYLDYQLPVGWQADKLELELFDLQGRQLLLDIAAKNEQQIRLNFLQPSGFYILRLNYDGQFIRQIKLLK
ncbi:MAG: choice-of-anchor B family protein [Bacteroidota bacterium]